jgi:hypothetical protein
MLANTQAQQGEVFVLHVLLGPTQEKEQAFVLSALLANSHPKKRLLFV